jgi:hypothetical protein
MNILWQQCLQCKHKKKLLYSLTLGILSASDVAIVRGGNNIEPMKNIDSPHFLTTWGTKAHDDEPLLIIIMTYPIVWV